MLSDYVLDIVNIYIILLFQDYLIRYEESKGEDKDEALIRTLRDDRASLVRELQAHENELRRAEADLQQYRRDNQQWI